MGKAGELNSRLNYLKVGDNKIHLRGTKGKEGESGTTSAVVLTVLFGPIGLIKHGKNVEIKQGTALRAFVADDTPPACRATCRAVGFRISCSALAAHPKQRECG